MIIKSCFLKKSLLSCVRNVNLIQKANDHNRARIGNREWVGWGKNGMLAYMDDRMFPFPSIRYKENSNELLALREKEKGDWRKLSIEEKKCLYRASFRQTFAEVSAPTGQWKSILGWVLILTSTGIWLFIGVKLSGPPLPITFSEPYRRAALRKLIDCKFGVASRQWDYDLDDWKK